MLSVTAGWVAFEFNGRESFVPAGASSRTDPRVGPGTPRYDDAAKELQAALDDFDYGTDAAAKARDLQLVLSTATPRDAMTLWHLIARVSPADRGAVDRRARRPRADARLHHARGRHASRQGRARSVVGRAGPSRRGLVAEMEGTVSGQIPVIGESGSW